jgi:hypothetical protein
MIDLAQLLRFPCDQTKRPLIAAWQKNASRTDHSHWPLVGVPTGEVNGFDVLDIDLAALGWRDQNRERFPFTQVHTTRSGGWHFLFRHHSGLRNSASRIAPGVDVRADGGFVIWWAREGLPFTSAELAEWPEWLLELARKPELVGPVEKGPCKSPPAHDGAHADRDGKTFDLRNRSFALTQKVAHAIRGKRNDTLNWAAFRFSEMIAEGVIMRNAAEKLLRGAAQACGLWREDGAAQCLATIKSGIDAGIMAWGGVQRDLHGPLSYPGAGNRIVEPFRRRKQRQSDELPHSINAASSTAKEIINET